MIARSESRGLGLQSLEVVRHLDPVSVLHVCLDAKLTAGFERHDDWYPGATKVGFDGHRFDDVPLVKDWLADLDVVYTPETPYDWRLCSWAARAGTAVVVHTNPELHRPVADRDGMEPTVWWNPTSWHMDLLRQPDWTRAPVVEMPMPVATDRDYGRPNLDDGQRPTFLHVMGHYAAGDRNGTGTVARALRRVNAGQRWVMRAQKPEALRLPETVTADVTMAGPADDYWDLYRGADVLVMPRKYGGLALSVQEACAAGLAIVMSDCPPNRRWPIVPVLAEHPQKMNRRGVIVHAPNFVDLAMVCDRLDDNPGEVREAQAASLLWADANSWDRLTPAWTFALTLAADRT